MNAPSSRRLVLAFFLLTLAAAGSLLPGNGSCQTWSLPYAGSTHPRVLFADFVRHPSGDLSVAGLSGYDVVLVRLAASGDERWRSVFRPIEYALTLGPQLAASGEDVVLTVTYTTNVFFEREGFVAPRSSGKEDRYSLPRNLSLKPCG